MKSLEQEILEAEKYLELLKIKKQWQKTIAELNKDLDEKVFFFPASPNCTSHIEFYIGDGKGDTISLDPRCLGNLSEKIMCAWENWKLYEQLNKC